VYLFLDIFKGPRNILSIDNRYVCLIYGRSQVEVTIEAWLEEARFDWVRAEQQRTMGPPKPPFHANLFKQSACLDVLIYDRWITHTRIRNSNLSRSSSDRVCFLSSIVTCSASALARLAAIIAGTVLSKETWAFFHAFSFSSASSFALTAAILLIGKLCTGMILLTTTWRLTVCLRSGVNFLISS